MGFPYRVVVRSERPPDVNKYNQMRSIPDRPEQYPTGEQLPRFARAVCRQSDAQ